MKTGLETISALLRGVQTTCVMMYICCVDKMIKKKLMRQSEGFGNKTVEQKQSSVFISKRRTREGKALPPVISVTQHYGVFTPEQDKDKTRTNQMLNLCIPMMPFTPGPTCLV